MAVFAIRSLSRARLGAENQVEPSSGTSRAPSGVVWGSPGGVLATNWASGRVLRFLYCFLEVLFAGAFLLEV